MGVQIVTVVGGGTMGNGIAHVCALSGREVRITDVSQDILDQALSTISKNLDRQVKKGIIDEAGRGEALERIRPVTDLDAATAGSQLIIEAVPEKQRSSTFFFVDSTRPPLPKRFWPATRLPSRSPRLGRRRHVPTASSACTS